MPRSYSFDHFQVPKTATKHGASLRAKDKEHFAQTHKAPAEEGIHYGKAHAETEQILQARAMAHQLEELAEVNAAAAEPVPAPRRGRAKKPAAAAARAAPPEAVTNPVPGSSAPIGAVPHAATPAPERPALRDLVDEADRQLTALRGALRDVQQAAAKLVGLPLEAARLAARRLHLVHG